MSNLDNLTSKILTDSKERSAAITKEAADRAVSIMQEYITAAEEEKKHILDAGAKEAGQVSEQMLLAKKLEIRDSHLHVKQEVLNRVFTMAIERLNNMNKEDYFRFLSEMLKHMDINGEEIIIPKKYHVTSIDELNTYLQDEGGKGNLKLSSDGNIEGGFILIKDGIEQNNTFEALVNFYRYELESKITETLF